MPDRKCESPQISSLDSIEIFHAHRERSFLDWKIGVPIQMVPLMDCELGRSENLANICVMLL